MAASSTRALVGALAANLGIAATKFIVGFLTGSTVMVAEGIHSLVDTGDSALMMLGTARSRRPADDAHPFGHGMELYFWSFVVAMVVFGAGGGLSAYEGVRSLIHPRALTQAWPSYLVIGVAAAFETGSLVIGAHEFNLYRRERRFSGSVLSTVRASKDPAIFVTILEDTAALVGLVLAAAAVTLRYYLHASWAEGVASILIGVVLILEAALLGYESRSLIVGESARDLVVRAIRDVLARHPEVGPVSRILTLQLGPEAILVVLQLRFPAEMPVRESVRLSERLEADLRGAQPAIRHIFFDLTAESLTCASNGRGR